MPELRIEKRLGRHVAAALAARALALPLTHAQRSRSRQLAQLADGRSVALLLQPGPALRAGELLVATSGEWVCVAAVAEALLEARSADAHLVARAAYHLGNRHVAVDIAPGRLRLEPDPVLEALLARIGMDVRHVVEPFEPEPGAYEGGHRHGHAESYAADYALAQAAYGAHQPLGPAATDSDTHSHDTHSHDTHSHDTHSHDTHSHDTHSHDTHSHDTHSHDTHSHGDAHGAGHHGHAHGSDGH